MARSLTTYEVHVLQNGKWSIHANFPASKKDEALEEAYRLEKIPGLNQVKVVREVYSPDTGLSQDTTVFKSQEKKSPVQDWAGVGGGRGYGPRPGAKYAEPDWDSGSKKKQKSSSTGSVLLKILLVVILAIAAAATITGITIGVLQKTSITGSTGTTILFVVFIISFLTSAFFLARTLLAGESLTTQTRKPAPAKKEQKPEPEPEPEPEPTEEEAAEEPEEEAPAEDESEEEENSNILSPYAEKQRLLCMSFIGQSLKQLTPEQRKMDSFNKFGLNLFMAGAVEGMSQMRELDPSTTATILTEGVQLLGFRQQNAEEFAAKYTEYLLSDPRYMNMFQAGRMAISAHIEGDEESPGKMSTALVDWNKPKVKEEAVAPVTVMFTDIAGSTAMTQELGDAIAQQVVRAHNRVVREALTDHDGREIKHTGDGIMASFQTTSGAVEATMQIQRATQAHNRSYPDLPLKIKIGLNAGEPLSEDDDLYGSVVQMSARIVDKATANQILVSEIVRSLCTGKGFVFTHAGDFEMKGFDAPVPLYAVAWDPDATPETPVETAVLEAEVAANTSPAAPAATPAEAPAVTTPPAGEPPKT